MGHVFAYFAALAAAVLAVNLWLLRTRDGDLVIIENCLASLGLRSRRIRRRLLRMWDGVAAEPLVTGRFAGPSRWSRVFVIDAETQDGARRKLTLAIDPWRRPDSPFRLK